MLRRIHQLGFTLLETALSLSLIAVILTLTWTHLSSTKLNQETRGAAESLTDRLRRLRQQAIATGVPTAVAFPSQNGQTPESQSCYFLSGEHQPFVSGSANWASDFPSAVCACASWPLTGGLAWSAPTAVPATNGFSLSSWASPYPTDPTFVFTPDGAVTADQPMFQGNYHVVVCQAPTFQAGLVAGVSTFTLQSAPSPWTVSISPTGQLSVTPGLLGGALPDQPGALVPAPAIVPGSSPNQLPVLGAVQAYPKIIPGSLPPGIDASVRPGGYVTFSAAATDPDGDPLSCQWTAAAGAFSSSYDVQMGWDALNQIWSSYWSFTPPPGAAPGQTYRLTCTVTDPKGGTARGTFGLNGIVNVTSKSLLVRNSDCDNPGVSRSMLISNIDGSERHSIQTGIGYFLDPRWSPDGKWIVYISAVGGPAYICHPDGTGVRLLITPASLGGTIDCLAFSVDGTKVIASGSGSTGMSIGWTTLAGMKPSNPTTPGVDMIITGIPGNGRFNDLSVQPTTGAMLIDNRTSIFYLVLPNGTKVPTTSSWAPPIGEFCFDPTGTKVYISGDGAGPDTIQRMDFNYTAGASSASLSNRVAVTSTYEDAVGGVSSDNKFLFFTRDLGGVQFQTWKIDLQTGVEYPLSSNPFVEDQVYVSP